MYMYLLYIFALQLIVACFCEQIAVHSSHYNDYTVNTCIVCIPFSSSILDYFRSIDPTFGRTSSSLLFKDLFCPSMPSTGVLLRLCMKASNECESHTTSQWRLHILEKEPSSSGECLRGAMGSAWGYEVFV